MSAALGVCVLHVSGVALFDWAMRSPSVLSSIGYFNLQGLPCPLQISCVCLETSGLLKLQTITHTHTHTRVTQIPNVSPIICGCTIIFPTYPLHQKYTHAHMTTTHTHTHTHTHTYDMQGHPRPGGQPHHPRLHRHRVLLCPPLYGARPPGTSHHRWV
jgi:hypothetical protein